VLVRYAKQSSTDEQRFFDINHSQNVLGLRIFCIPSFVNLTLVKLYLIHERNYYLLAKAME